MTLLNITSWRNNGSKQLHEKIKTKFKVNDKIKLLNFQIFLPLTRGGVAGQLRFFFAVIGMPFTHMKFSDPLANESIQIKFNIEINTASRLWVERLTGLYLEDNEKLSEMSPSVRCKM